MGVVGLGAVIHCVAALEYRPCGLNKQPSEVGSDEVVPIGDIYPTLDRAREAGRLGSKTRVNNRLQSER